MWLLKKKACENITKLYYTNQFAQINNYNNSKLRIFAKFKCDYALEKYVGISDISLSWRKMFVHLGLVVMTLKLNMVDILGLKNHLKKEFVKFAIQALKQRHTLPFIVICMQH